MEFEIKNVKYAAFASKETHCFECTIYIDGKRSFGASNDGHGGCNSYHPVNKQKNQNAIYEWVKEIDDKLGQEDIPVDDSGKYFVKNDLDIVVGDLMNKWLRVREAKRLLKRISYLYEGSIYQVASKFKPTPKNLEGVQKAEWWKKEFILLNNLPIEDVVEAIK